ncbi:unnamed protein product [Blepharisma stoltei]|uniref:Tetratricopeptide repeat protein n=1 Tax=Blepharisma stoltei TaxID=1481888 RepID=A0AAU9JIU8_9CILI|nr:unnamed protein product [Blepharisma stoltei]
MQSLRLVGGRTGNTYPGLCRLGIKYANGFMPYDAFQCFVKAIKLNQERGEAWINLGILYEIFDQFDQARAAYKEAESIEDTENIGKQMASLIGVRKKKDLQFFYPLTKIQGNCTEKRARKDIEDFQDLGRPNKKLKLRDRNYDEDAKTAITFNDIMNNLEKSELYMIEDIAKFLLEPKLE